MPLYNEPGAGQGKYPAILPESGFSNWGLHNFSDDTPLPDPDYDHGQDKREARGGDRDDIPASMAGHALEAVQVAPPEPTISDTPDQN